MHRRIAKFLLLFALVGNLVPLALAIYAPAPHACCLRKTVHSCHERTTSGSDQLVLRLGDCCNHECCRAVTTDRWAQTAPPVKNYYVWKVGSRLSSRSTSFPDTDLIGFQSSRAPPHSIS